MIATPRIFVAVCLLCCIGCQTPGVRLRAENAETGGVVTGVTVERQAQPQNGDAPATWDHLDLATQSSDGALLLNLPGQGYLDVLRISAPGYFDSYVRIDWREMAFSLPPNSAQFAFDPRHLPVWLKPLKSLVPNETITRLNQDWAIVLAKVVSDDGDVRWDLLQKNQDGVGDHLSRFIDQIGTISPENRPELFPHVKRVSERAQREAYWLNAYNALSMYWVVQHHYPQTIPVERPGRFLVGGKLMSFSDLETAAVYDDSAIHIFAMNFCARSCPPLRKEPYDGIELNQQLAEQARVYLQIPRAVVRTGDTLKVNDWIFRHRMEFPPHEQMQAKDAKLATEMLNGLEYYVHDSPLFKAYKRVVNMGFDWSLNRSAQGG